jgi:putative aldouronate transport system substrate-binding protein
MISNNLPHDLPQDFTQDVVKWYNDKCKVRDAGWAIDNAKFGVAMEAEGEFQTTLVEKYKEYRDKLTMCKPEEFDALYDQFAKEYAEAGYQAVAEERLAAYKDGNSTKLLNQTAEEVDLK